MIFIMPDKKQEQNGIASVSAPVFSLPVSLFSHRCVLSAGQICILRPYRFLLMIYSICPFRITPLISRVSWSRSTAFATFPGVMLPYWS